MTTPAALPPQKADFRDASEDRMTAFPVPNASNRACPSSFAGTTCRRDRSRISPSALQSAIRCRTDRSGRFRRRVTPLGFPRISATIPAYSRLARITPTHQQLAPGACSNFPTEPFPGLPVGDKRAFPLLAVSAPNSSQNGILLQNWRDLRPRHSRPLRRFLRSDVSTFSAITGARHGLGQRLKVGCPVVYSKTQCGKVRRENVCPPNPGTPIP